MRHALIIAAREIVDKKLLFLGAALCAIIVLMTPLLPGARSENAVQVMTAGALALAFAFVAATTIFLGIGIISRDLGEGRMSFYLARPVRIWSIWLGKTAAVLLIALGCGFVLVLIPTLFGGGLFSLGGFVEDLRSYTWIFGLVLRSPEISIPLLVLLLTVFALHLGLAIRSRTPWLGLDLAVMAGAAGLFFIELRPFFLVGGFWFSQRTFFNLASIGAVMLIVAVAAGNLLGFRRGRSDLQVAHKWTSLATSLLVVLGVTSFAGYAYKVRSFGIEKMRWVESGPGDNDDGWIAIAGRRAPEWNAYWAYYLVNVDTGESMPIPSVDSGDLRFASGCLLLWERTLPLGTGRLFSDLEFARMVKLVKIEPNTGSKQDLGYEANPIYLSSLAVDPDGEVAAWTINEQLQVIDVATGQSIFSARFPEPDPWTGWALSYLRDSRTLLVYVRAREGEGWIIYRVDLQEKQIETSGTLPEGFILSFSGENILHFTRGATPELRIAETGDLVATLERRSRMLPGGRAVVPDAENPTRLLILSPTGETETTVDLPRPGTLEGVREPREGALLVAQLGSLGHSKGLTTWFVDLETKEVTEVGRGIQPPYLGWRDKTVPPTGSVGSRILQDGDSAVFLFDPDTLELKHLAGGERGIAERDGSRSNKF